MAEKLTEQQRQAVTDRGGKLLVSAAAGSGKTKVLVDRLLSYIMDKQNPANLDDFLIITYTKAAAAELRGKIAAKLSEKIAEDPTNRHLQNQMQRLYLSKISTVHAFCGDIIRENAHLLDISADFRIAEEDECLEIQSRVLTDILEDAYGHITDNEDLRALVDSQGFGRDDRQIPEIILKVYQSAKCHLNPDAWLDWCLENTDVSELGDAGETAWGRYIIDDFVSAVNLHIDAMENCVRYASAIPDLVKPVALFQDIISQLRKLCSGDSWDYIVHHRDVQFGTLTFPRKCEETVLIEQMKAVRNACKEAVQKKLRAFQIDSNQVLADLEQCKRPVRGLVEITRRFMQAYDKRKRGSRVLDFGDLEHLTLDLLLGKKRSGPTVIAREIGNKFREVMVDEYQDTNEIQDAIFGAITQAKQNCFMVGDVKQSIYQFRLADPSIFLDKYQRYSPVTDAEPGKGRKVLLSKNFRSGGAVIEAVNAVFSDCMSQKVGGLDYGDDEALYEGIPHTAIEEAEIELHCINVDKDTYAEESAFTADRICQLLDGTHMIRDKDTLRPIRPEDIVILLRSPGSVGGEFRYALEQRGLQCVTDNGVDLLQTEEVSTLRAILQIISNPLQDIPLIAALSSRVFGFTADDLAQIRGENPGSYVFYSLQRHKSEKTEIFLSLLDSLRAEARISGLTGLVDTVIMKTDMYSIYAAMPDGDVKIENLQAFVQMTAGYEKIGERHLDQFLEHLDSLDKRGLTVQSKNSSAGAITIMSIHKSKGLEFPVVFLCGLSRTFNTDSTRGQILCDKTLGLGLTCLDINNRVRYPSVAKRAIALKMLSDGVSEELRVLYVAMTRARDRLIMTYAARNIDRDVSRIAMQMEMSAPLLLTSSADCFGDWVLLSALKRTEAGALSGLCGYSNASRVSVYPWSIQLNNVFDGDGIVPATEEESIGKCQDIDKIIDSLEFSYPYKGAVSVPSKQTATQMKGRLKDYEAAEGTRGYCRNLRSWRKPRFIEDSLDGKKVGNVMHKVMEHICYQKCRDIASVRSEIERMEKESYITQQEAELVDADQILTFFTTEVGRKLRLCKEVLREFKFSVLVDASEYFDGVVDDKILMQGVIDCAMIEDDGLTIIDFKTDRIADDLVESAVESHHLQVEIYAKALSRIFQKPIKAKYLYFFSCDALAEVK